MSEKITWKLNRGNPTLALVIPCYNEEEMIGETITQLQTLLDKLMYSGNISPDSFMLFVDDGSTDNTLAIIRNRKSKNVSAIKLAANAGHQLALIAGLNHVAKQCDCAISLDADLQDDLGVIPNMVSDFKNGAHIVYGIRDNRKTDSGFKRTTAQAYYTLMRKMGVNLIHNHADFRLTSAVVLHELLNYREVNLFLRGIFPTMGFMSTYVYYTRSARSAGTSKYPLRKMIALAINGITSFTNLPLKIITWTGFAVFLGSLALSGWVLIVSFTGNTVPGWASITLPVYFIGGIQLLALGVMGEYLARIYMETKQRPRYHVEEVLEHNSVESLDFSKEIVHALHIDFKV